MDDCCALTEMLLGAEPVGPVPLTLGILEIVSLAQLEVTAVYTASGDDGPPAVEVKRIEAKRLTRGVASVGGASKTDTALLGSGR
jgi:hypothetical protein